MTEKPAILRYFAYDHLPSHLAQISAPFHMLAHGMADQLPPGPELSAGLRKLLEAKDCMVRAALDAPPPAAEPEQPDMTCPHCPDGHTPPNRGSQPWGAYLGPERDGDGQPTTIHVLRAGGAHVAESDAQWVLGRISRDARRHRAGRE
ncbi:hypothetical protein [Streptomyces cinereoruber]|uniref:hypothetical protein n=1 Tax=Streptomyces cinereoruber TaxID=67260 RepID=UPI0036312FC7